MRHSDQPMEKKKKVLRHSDLEVYQQAFAAAMEVFKISKVFPKDDRYSLIDQVRRSSRTVEDSISEG